MTIALEHPDQRRQRLLARLGAIVWIGFAVGICIATLLKPDLITLKDGSRFAARVLAEETTTLRIVRLDGADRRETIRRDDLAERIRFGGRSVTPEYHRAAILWWRGQSPYTGGVHGFLYLPQFITLYTPFALVPPLLEATLWRLAGIVLYAGGVASLCRLLFPQRFGGAFLFASALAIFGAMGSAANGQTNLHIGGLLALAAGAVGQGRWWRATGMLLLALALKPTALVLLLLFGAVYPRPIAWRAAIAVLAFAALPLLHPDPQFAWAAYQGCIGKMREASAPTDRFQDIRGMLIDFGVARVGRDGPPPPTFETAMTGVRIAGALATLGLGFLASRRFGDPARAMLILTLGVIYVMLFSPRTEGVTYAILGPVAALWGAREIVARRWLIAVPLIAYCLLLQFSRLLTGSESNYWVRPSATVLFAALVIAEIVRGRTRWPSSC